MYIMGGCNRSKASFDRRHRILSRLDSSTTDSDIQFRTMDSKKAASRPRGNPEDMPFISAAPDKIPSIIDASLSMLLEIGGLPERETQMKDLEESEWTEQEDGHIFLTPSRSRDAGDDALGDDRSNDVDTITPRPLWLVNAHALVIHTAGRHSGLANPEELDRGVNTL
ncbi:hypothetical protein B0H14DRAFT_2594256 [Mycena olivaceomarginata]|nr:hypothetical protein B0H14DRAFT_2594256 [Mycena olivaceomarginata]